jgi:hypothetical protein
MKPKMANSKPLYQITALGGGIYRPDLVFTTPENAQKFAASELAPGILISVNPVNIVVGLEEDEVDRLVAEKKTLEAKLAEVNKKLRGGPTAIDSIIGALFKEV